MLNAKIDHQNLQKQKMVETAVDIKMQMRAKNRDVNNYYESGNHLSAGHI